MEGGGDVDGVTSFVTDLDEPVMFYRTKEDESLLVFRKENEEGRVKFIPVRCTVVEEGGDRAKSKITYLRAGGKRPERKGKEDSGRFWKALGAISKVINYAVNKQAEFEKTHPKKAKFCKYLLKTAIPFPLNLALEAPAIRRNVGEFRQIFKMPKKEAVKRFGEQGVEVLGNMFADGQIPSGKKIMETITENVLCKEREVGKEEEESKTETKEDNKVEKQEDYLVIVVSAEVTEGGEEWILLILLNFDIRTEEEKEENDKLFRDYISTSSQGDEDEDSDEDSEWVKL